MSDVDLRVELAETPATPMSDQLATVTARFGVDKHDLPAALTDVHVYWRRAVDGLPPYLVIDVDTYAEHGLKLYVNDGLLLQANIEDGDGI